MATNSALPLDVTVIVSSTLEEFFHQNTPPVVAESSKIILKLLQNAIKEGKSTMEDKKHRKVRLGNPKIHQHVVQVPGALDILGLAGFVAYNEQGDDKHETFLIFGQQDSPSNPLELYLDDNDDSAATRSSNQEQQQRELVKAICLGLQTKKDELDLQENASNNKKQRTTSNNNTNNNPFLSEEERRARHQKILAMKKAKKAAQAATLQRWQEDNQERKEAAERREALLQAAGKVDANSEASPMGVIIRKKKAALPLAKPMQEAMGLDQQKEALAKLARARYERMTAAKETHGTVNSTSMDGDDDDDDDKELEDQKLPAENITGTSPQDSMNIDSKDTSSKSAQWDDFIQKVPRCASSQGIRDTSCYTRHDPPDPDLVVPLCLKHLFRELDGLKDSLPSDPNASIWLRFDEETPQYIRAMMAAPLPGPTPYSGGLFLFDIYIPGNYPQVAPKVTLLTTGGGKVRFGPNLYACGKVCLSLLGTWSGPKWDPRHSSLYQVLISIQGLLLGIEHPYYLEPGFGGWEDQVKEGDFQITGHTLKGDSVKEEVGVPIKVVLYEDELRVGTVKYAMLDPLVSCATFAEQKGNDLWQPFLSVIRAHFSSNRHDIVIEVRKWMSDQALGRNRSFDSSASFTIDQLRALVPKLEERLSRVAMPGSDDNDRKLAAKTKSNDNDDTTPVTKPAAAEPAGNGGNVTMAEVDDAADSEQSGTDIDYIEQKRVIMQEAGGKGDYVRAGQLQEEINRLEELRKSMEDAAKKGDFIRAGRLQAQFKALTSQLSSTNPKPAHTQPFSLQNEMMDDDHDDNDSGSDSDADMDEAGMPPHGLGNNVFTPPVYDSHKTSLNHAWGSGSKLAAVSAPAVSISLVKQPPPVARRVIPVEQLCRLRIRLPTNKSVVEDFDKSDHLSAVYRRLEDSVSYASGQRAPTVAPRVVGNGAFSQPLSSVGFTLLLTRPKREFSLEMHGTKSLDELNLAPSATLTVMKCSDRGIMHRGELESRLRQAQGDAIDVEGLTYEGLVELTERLGAAAPVQGTSFIGLSRKELEFHSEVFSASTYLRELESYTEEANDDDLRCPICLGEYDSTDTSKSLRKLSNCDHIFHTGCLETWLRTKSSCPLCKKSVCPDS